MLGLLFIGAILHLIDAIKNVFSAINSVVPLWIPLVIVFWACGAALVLLLLSYPFDGFVADAVSDKSILEGWYRSIWSNNEEDMRYLTPFWKRMFWKRRRHKKSARAEYESTGGQRGSASRTPWWFSREFSPDDIRQLSRLRARITVKSAERFNKIRFHGSVGDMRNVAGRAGLFCVRGLGKSPKELRVFMFFTDRAAYSFSRAYDSMKGTNASYSGEGHVIPSKGGGYDKLVLMTSFEIGGVQIHCG